MNRHFLLFIAFCLLGITGGWAQFQSNSDGITNQRLSIENRSLDCAALVYSNDFSDCSTWSFGSAGQGTWLCGTGIAPSNGLETINSETASNGFALVDVYQGGDGNCWIQTQSAIPLPSGAGAVVEFDFYGNADVNSFNDYMFLEVSTDGINWPSTTNTNPNPFRGNLFDFDTFDRRQNAYAYRLNISSIIGDADQIWLRFHWVGDSGAYMIDDLKVYEPVVDDFQLSGQYVYDQLSPEFADFAGFFQLRSCTPNQATSFQVESYVTAENFSQQASSFNLNRSLNGETLWNEDVDFPAVFNGPGGILAEYNFYQIGLDAFPWPNEIGQHVLTSEITGDECATGNSLSTTLYTSEDEYGYTTFAETTTGFGIWGGTQNEWGLGNVCNLNNPDEIEGLGVYISSESTIGCQIRAELYLADAGVAYTFGNFIQPQTLLGQSSAVTITQELLDAAQQGERLDLLFDQSGAVQNFSENGQFYLALVRVVTPELGFGLRAEELNPAIAFNYVDFYEGAFYKSSNVIPAVNLLLSGEQPCITPEACLDPVACNYDPDTSCTENPDACIYPVCFDATACNYDQNGICSDQSLCEYESCLGCVDSSACNYNDTATINDGSCAYLDVCGECGGEGVLGCTDDTACNYSFDATCSDNSCEFDSCAGCTNNEACNFDGDASIDDGSCEFLSSGTILGANVLEEFSASSYALEDVTDATLFWNITGGVIQSGQSTELIEVFWAGEGLGQVCVSINGQACAFETCLSVVITPEVQIPGCTNEQACNYNAEANVDNGSCILVGDACDDEDDTTENDSVQADCSCLGNTVVVDVLGCTNEQACNYNAEANVDNGSCILVGDACDDEDDTTENDSVQADCSCSGNTVVIDVPGCTNEQACNYNAEANVDNGSCILVGDACDDEDDTTENDSVQADCSCSGNTVVIDVLGCTNEQACNYNAEANVDNGSCILVGDACDDGDNLTENDSVQADCSCEGVAIQVDVFGCTALDACNYNPLANVDDGSCEYVTLFEIIGSSEIGAGAQQTYVYSETPGSTYFWTVTNGAILNGQGTNSISVVWGDEGPGSVSIVETNSDACEGEAVSIDIVVVTNIVELDDESMFFYPNPCTDDLHFDIEQGLTLDVMIYNALGEKVVEQKQIQGKGEFDLRSLAAGFYTIQAIQKEGYLRQVKILIQH